MLINIFLQVPERWR